MSRKCVPLLVATLLLSISPGRAADDLAPTGAAASAIEAWIAAGTYDGCMHHGVCAPNPSLRYDVRYAPTSDRAIAFVSWRAPDGAAGTTIGVFREDNDGWTFTARTDDLPAGNVRKVLFNGLRAAFEICRAFENKSCVGGFLDLGG